MVEHLVIGVRAGEVVRFRRRGTDAWATARRLAALGWMISVMDLPS